MSKRTFMKKRIIISVTCIAVAVIYVDAQNKSAIVPVTATTIESIVAAPPPQPPVPPLPPAIDEAELPIPPVPPLPPAIDEAELPIPPVPPVPFISTDEPGVVNTETTGPEIINSNGNEISIRTIKGKTMVVVMKDGKIQKIKLTTWNANRKYYEKKYGQLPPPPPPPPPAPVVE